MTTTLVSFDTADQFASGPSIFRGFRDNPTAQDALMLRTTRTIENRCGRRLVSFTKSESHRAEGVDQDGFGNADMPMNLQTALGWSQSVAFANTNLVRDVWLDECAPVFPDMWSYTLVQIELLLAYGDNMTVGAGSVQGPQPDSGWLRLNLGTFAPVGTTIVVTYSGGYDPIPDDLQQAAIFQAMKFALLGAEPEQRKDLSTAELDAEILGLIAPYIR